MSAKTSKADNETEDLGTILQDLRSRFEELHRANDQISSSNSFLTEVIASCDRFKKGLLDETARISDKYGIEHPKNGKGDTYQNQIISTNEECAEVIKKFSSEKVKDAFNAKELRKIRSIFQQGTDLKKCFFSVQKVPIPRLSSHTIASMTEPLDPMRFTKLFNFPEDFSEIPDFEKCCAFQVFNAKLENLIDGLEQQRSVLTAKYDDTTTFLVYPQEKTLETFPKFRSFVGLHRKFRTELKETSTACSLNISKILNQLNQMKNRLSSTTQFFNRSIAEMKEETQAARKRYVDVCIKLCKYRTIEQIKQKSDGGITTKHMETMLRYSETENNFIDCIIVFEKIQIFLGNITKFKNEAEATNQEYRKILTALEKNPVAKKVEEDTKEKQNLRNISEIMEQQLMDGFTAFSLCFKIASDMAMRAEEYMTVLKDSGKSFDNADYLINEVARTPARTWMKSIEKRTTELLEAKKGEKGIIDAELAKINNEIDEERSKGERLKQNGKMQSSHSCDDCKLNPEFCICGCGHTFCRKCIEAATNDGKCPICGIKFSKDDVIQIAW